MRIMYFEIQKRFLTKTLILSRFENIFCMDVLLNLLPKVVFNDIRAVSVIFNMLVQIVHTNS
jgi:hypothetical protein